MLVRQASYFSMYSSHSGTPVLSPVATVFVLAVLVVVVSDLLQLANPIALQSIATINIAFPFNLIIVFVLSKFKVISTEKIRLDKKIKLHLLKIHYPFM